MQHVIELANTSVVTDEVVFRGMFPEVSFPAPLRPTDVEPFGYGVYQFSDKPAVLWNQKAVSADPVANDSGVYVQQWVVQDLTGEELDSAMHAEADRVRALVVAREQYQQDAFAKTRSYDDIKSASSYAGCPVLKFDVEGTYCRDVRARRWEKLYEIMAEVNNGSRPMPSSYEEVEAELPPMQWPV